MDPEHKEWVSALVANVTSDQRIRGMAWNVAEEMREPEDPQLSLADMAASVNYLRVCLLRRSQTEVSVMTTGDYAGLWGLGCLGAARHRARRAIRKAPKPKGRKGSSRRP